MNDSEFLRKQQSKWLEWVEGGLKRPGRSPEQVEALRQRAKILVEQKLKSQLERLGEMEVRGIPKAIAEELILLRARIDGLEELLKHLPDILSKTEGKQKLGDLSSPL